MKKFRVRGYLPNPDRPVLQWAKAYPIIKVKNRQDAKEKFKEMFPGYIIESVTEEVL